MKSDEEKYAYLWKGRSASTNIRNPKTPEAYKRYHILMEYEAGKETSLVIIDTYLAPAVVNVYRFKYDMVLANKLPKKDKEHLIAYGASMINIIVNILNTAPSRLNMQKVPGLNLKNFG